MTHDVWSDLERALLDAKVAKKGKFRFNFSSPTEFTEVMSTLGIPVATAIRRRSIIVPRVVILNFPRVYLRYAAAVQHIHFNVAAHEYCLKPDA